MKKVVIEVVITNTTFFFLICLVHRIGRWTGKNVIWVVVAIIICVTMFCSTYPQNPPGSMDGVMNRNGFNGGCNNCTIFLNYLVHRMERWTRKGVKEIVVKILFVYVRSYK